MSIELLGMYIVHNVTSHVSICFLTVDVNGPAWLVRLSNF